jgi:mutator protein MutT
MDTVDVAIGVVLERGRVLICQRPENVTLPGLWEFPGGKRLPDESLEQCLARELREELAIEVRPVESLPPIQHDYPFARVRLHPFLCTRIEGEPHAIGCQQFQWIDPRQLPQFPFPPANAPLLKELIHRFAGPSGTIPTAGADHEPG